MKGRRIVFTDRLKVEIEVFEVASPKAGEVLIETDYSVISPGTELACLQGLPNAIKPYPQGVGYSGAGRITAIGPSVEGFAVGDRVVMDHCGHASHALCAVSGWRGQGITKIEDDRITSQSAAFLPIASMSLQGVRKSRPELGESVLVAGLGLLGLFAVRFAALSGALPVLALDFDAPRRALALAFGADAALSPDDAELGKQIMERTRNRGCDVMVEVTGSPSALPQLLPLLAYRGRVSLLGCARGITDGINFYEDIHKKGAVIIGAHNFVRPLRDPDPGYWTTRDDFRVLLDLLRSGRLDVRPLISAVIPPEDAPQAYAQSLNRENGRVGVVFEWQRTC